jgi:hypothetical protein
LQADPPASLFVGTRPGEGDVVAKGVTLKDYRPYKAHETGRVLVFDSQTSFWVWSEGVSLGALEPLALSSRPIVNVRLSHAPAPHREEGPWGDAATLVLGPEPLELVAAYTCVSYGVAAITVVLPVLPRGSQVTFTWTVVCGGEVTPDPLRGPRLHTTYPWQDARYTQYSAPDPTYFLDDPKSSSSSALDPSSHISNLTILYAALGRYRPYWRDFDASDEQHWNVFVDEELLYAKSRTLGWLNVGTGVDGSFLDDVVAKGQVCMRVRILYVDVLLRRPGHSSPSP